MSTQRNAIQTVSTQLSDSAYWLIEHSRVKRLSDELRLMFLKARPVLKSEALWEGHWAVRRDCNVCVERIKERGGLLFMGSAVALAEAVKLEKVAKGGEQA